MFIIIIVTNVDIHFLSPNIVEKDILHSFQGVVNDNVDVIFLPDQGLIAKLDRKMHPWNSLLDSFPYYPDFGINPIIKNYKIESVVKVLKQVNTHNTF